MEIKRYVLLEDNAINDNDKYEWDEIFFKIIATSDNILELAREGDLVRDYGDIYELFEVNGELVFYPDEVANYLMEEQKNITMLYKKVGNNYIGYEMK